MAVTSGNVLLRVRPGGGPGTARRVRPGTGDASVRVQARRPACLASGWCACGVWPGVAGTCDQRAGERGRR
jgi:hypothetical protein